jgi:hypothetical protein
MPLTLRSCARAAFSMLLAFPGSAMSADAVILWPEGWEVESLPQAEASDGQPAVQLRQRAVKNDQNGDPAMIVELTQTQLQPGHAVNVQGVLLAMRKAVQVNFSDIPAMETTCTITQNGNHVMTQTLVAAASPALAWSLSYAGSAQGYAANKDQVMQIRNSLRLGSAPDGQDQP